MRSYLSVCVQDHCRSNQLISLKLGVMIVLKWSTVFCVNDGSRVSLMYLEQFTSTCCEPFLMRHEQFPGTIYELKQ